MDSNERAAVADALKALETSGLRAAGVRMRQIKGKLWEIKASQQRVFYVVVMGGELESGKVVPRLDFLEKVARALGGHLDVRIVEGKGNA